MEVFSMDWRDLGEILEMVMIVCFGISWPLSVYKSYKAIKIGAKCGNLIKLAAIAAITRNISSAYFQSEILLFY